jgi:trehalose 6-phosphate phosphatase
MTPVMECDAGEEEAAIQAMPAEARLDEFFRSVAEASASVLLVDFDGTLAPFRVDPAKVRPWAGVTRLLEGIQAAGRTQLALVSGRPARDVARQLGMQRTPEVWGLHGAERLWPDGHMEVEVLPEGQIHALHAARVAVRESGVVEQLGLRVEEKGNAVVVHWRGKAVGVAHAARDRMMAVLQPFAKSDALEMMLFDGGVEVRCGRDKGDAVRLVLEEMDANLPVAYPVAYLGDDVTDEHAFEALGQRGLSILVRRVWRPTAAHMWLRPPAQLREFLARWLAAVEG